jgi:glycosyltransferase involved in cell wall biosynthesis
MDVPVVATNVGNVKDIAKDVEGCFVSESNSPKELAHLVLRAMEYERVKGRERLVKLGLDMESVAEKVIKVYRNALRLHERKDGR